MYDADAVRVVLHNLLVEQYGGIEAAALKVGIPHKTLHRAFTQGAKDRTKTVSLDIVMTVIGKLSELDPGISFQTVVDKARELR